MAKNNEKSLVNEKQKDAGKKLLIVGGILLVISILLDILAPVMLWGKILSGSILNGLFTGGIFYALYLAIGLVGFGLIIAGATLLLLAHEKKIDNYTKEKVAPSVKKGANQVSEEVGRLAGKVANSDIAKSVKKGYDEARKK